MDIYQSNISFLSCCTLQYMIVLSYPLCCQPHRMLLTYDRMMHDQSVFVFHFLHMIVVSLFYTTGFTIITDTIVRQEIKDIIIA